jgi:hypothetical protein
MAGKTSKTPTARPRPSARAVAEQADRILADALKRERDYKRKGMSSVTIPREELIRKLSGRTAHSPFLTQIGWGNPVRGSTFVLSFGLMNPDPWPYDNGNLALCYCYSDAGAVTEPGLTLLRAEPSIGVRQVDLGTLNTAPMPYLLTANHTIPAGFRVGPSDLDYFLYTPDAWAAGTLLMRGTIRLDVA